MQATIEEVLASHNVPAELRPHVTDTMRDLVRSFDDPLTLKAEVHGDEVTLRNDAGDRLATINVEVWKWVRYLRLSVPNFHELARAEKLPLIDPIALSNELDEALTGVRQWCSNWGRDSSPGKTLCAIEGIIERLRKPQAPLPYAADQELADLRRTVECGELAVNSVTVLGKTAPDSAGAFRLTLEVRVAPPLDDLQRALARFAVPKQAAAGIVPPPDDDPTRYLVVELHAAAEALRNGANGLDSEVNSRDYGESMNRVNEMQWQLDKARLALEKLKGIWVPGSQPAVVAAKQQKVEVTGDLAKPAPKKETPEDIRDRNCLRCAGADDVSHTPGCAGADEDRERARAYYARPRLVICQG